MARWDFDHDQGDNHKYCVDSGSYRALNSKYDKLLKENKRLKELVKDLMEFLDDD